VATLNASMASPTLSSSSETRSTPKSILVLSDCVAGVV
jgi:hypothetical protein